MRRRSLLDFVFACAVNYLSLCVSFIKHVILPFYSPFVVYQPPLPVLLEQKKNRVRIWLYEDTKTQLEGQIIGFDEYMNMVLDDAVEIGKKRVEVGRILLKGDSITLIQEAQPQKPAEQPPTQS